MGAPERSKIPLRGLRFWERYLPWALLRILRVFLQIKREREVGGRSGVDEVGDRGGVC